MNLLELLEREPKRGNRTLKPLEQIHRHQGTQALLTILLLQPTTAAANLSVVHLLVFGATTRQYVSDRGVDAKFQGCELNENIIEADHIRTHGERAMEGKRLAAR